MMENSNESSVTQKALDTISRQAAIDTVMEFMPSLTTPDGCGQFDREIFEAQEMFVDIGQALNELPSAQPKSANELSKTAQNVPNSDFISRKAAIDAVMAEFSESGYSDCWDGLKVAVNIIEDLPTAQPDYDLSDYSDKLWRNAYERGRAEAKAEIIRCKDCKYYKDSDECFFSTAVTSDDGFCHWAERRTDEAD